MAGFISEFFGYRASDRSEEALSVAAKKTCPFTGDFARSSFQGNGLHPGYVR